MTDCYTCATENALDDAPDRERVWVGEHWRLSHAFDTALPGWLVLVPRRHVTRIAEHGRAEAAELGTLLVAASAALETVTGCTKTYVAQFAEAAGFAHTHFHVVPRPADLPEDRRGPRVFGLLGAPVPQRVSEAARDDLARRLRAVIADSLGATT
ncbi:MAG TPA: HIT family protein [Segeticoccus sp.]|nr:HIT family protein [Segeticoccus sp.]